MSKAQPSEAEADAEKWGLTRVPGVPRQAACPAGVWPDNVPAMTAFLTVQGQWRAVSFGMAGVQWLGLDYAAAEAGLSLAGITVTPDMWGKLRLIEAGAIEELNRRD